MSIRIMTRSKKESNCVETTPLECKSYESICEAQPLPRDGEIQAAPDETLLNTDKRQRDMLWFSAFLLNIGMAFLLSGAGIVAPVMSSIFGGGMGVIIPAVLTGSAMFGSFVATLVLHKLGFKTTLILAGILYTLSLIGNFYPTWFTLVPASVLGGVCLAGCTLTQRTYIGLIAETYSSKFGQDKDRIYSRLFVLSAVCNKGISMAGSLCSSFILGIMQQSTTVQQDIAEFPMFTNSTQSFSAPEGLLHVCGADYCNEDLGSSYEIMRNAKSSIGHAPSSTQFYGLMLLYMIVCATGVLILWLFVLHFKVTETKSKKSDSKLLLATFAQFKDPKLLLLLPMALLIQSPETFWSADFNKAFVTCSSGIQYVGVVAMWSSFSAMIASCFFGWFNKNSIRSIPLTVSSLALLSVLIVIFNWKPGRDNLLEMSTITAIFFLGSSITKSLVPALFGVIFSDNLVAAYTIMNMFTYGGSTLMYAWSHFLCMNVKMYIMLGLVVASYVGYVIVEVIIYRERKKSASLGCSRTTNL